MLQNTEPYPRFGVQDFIEKVDGPCPVVPGMWFVRPTGYLGGAIEGNAKKTAFTLQVLDNHACPQVALGPQGHSLGGRAFQVRR